MKKITMYCLILINFVGQLFVYLHMQGKLDTVPDLEGIKNDGLFLLIPSTLLLTAPLLTKHAIVTKFLAILSLSSIIIILSAYIGVYQAMSPFERPQYFLSILASAGIIVLLNHKENS